jgi:hypothetical protein
MIETILIVAAVGIVGWPVLWLLSRILFRDVERADKAQRMNEQHDNLSVGENFERRRLLDQIHNATGEHKRQLWALYHQTEAEHKGRWNGRVREIIDVEVPYDEDVLASVQRGENPYKAPKKSPAPAGRTRRA